MLASTAQISDDLESGVIYDMNVTPHFSGVFGPFSAFVWETGIGFISKGLFNFTVLRQKEFGSRNKLYGNYSGCYGSLMRNESDITITSIEDPTDDYSRVRPFRIITDDKLAIQQAYNRSKSAIKIDIFQTGFKSFQVHVWIVILLTAVVFGILFFWIERMDRIKKRLFRRIKSEIRNLKFLKPIKRLLSIIFSNMIHLILIDLFIDSRTCLVRFISMLYLVFAFVVVNYYRDLMATEMVVIPRPSIFNSYKEIYFDDNVIPTFSLASSDHVHFKDAKEGSWENKLWRKGLERARNYTDLFLPQKFETEFLQKVIDFHQRRRVFIAYHLFSSASKVILCNLRALNDNHDIMLWDAFDPKGERFMKQLTVRGGLDLQDKFIKRYMTRVVRSSEANLISYVRSHLITSNTMLNKFPVRLTHSQLEQCLSDTLVMDLPETQSVSVSNFFLLLTFSLMIIIVCGIILFMEFLSKK